MAAKKSATSNGPAASTFKDTTETKPAVPPESDREQKRNLAYLVVLAGVSAGEMFKLQEDKTVVGRGPTVGVRLNDEGVSREHCQFMREGEKIIVVDLGSTNGTYVQPPGQHGWHRLTPQQLYVLAAGCDVLIGDRTLMFDSPHARI